MSTTYTVNPAYPTHYGNVIFTGSNTTMTGISGGAGSGTNWSSVTLDPYYSKQPKVKITDSDIELDGLSMRQTLLDLQSRLGIMTPNPELEKEFTELRECADRYRELEKKFSEQKAVWETLKKQDS